MEVFKPGSRLPRRTWDPTSSRPARQPTTLTARQCPSERAPSRRAPTWRGSWTPSKTVSTETGTTYKFKTRWFIPSALQTGVSNISTPPPTQVS